MTPNAALLPHERLCPDCHGEKVVEVSGVHPSRPAGGVTAMEAPDTWTEPCDTCDRTGVVLNERREHERPAGSAWTDFVRSNHNAQLLAADVERLEREGHAQRAVIQQQARDLDLAKEENRRLRILNRKQSDLIDEAAHHMPGGPQSKGAIQ